MTKPDEEIARKLAGEDKGDWQALLQSTRDFWINVAQRSKNIEELKK